MSTQEEKLLFSLTESVWFKQGMAVTDIRSLSLEPIVHIEEKEDSIVMKGYLQLYGEYDPDLSGHLEMEKDSLRDITGERTLQEITVDQNGVWTLRHQFPLDVEIPRERVLRTDDLSIRIQMFDYELLSERCLEIKTDIEILGVGTPVEDRIETEAPRSVMDEEMPVYKTGEPQIYAEMNTRETEEIFLEQVNEQVNETPEAVERMPTVEAPLYIQPMMSASRDEDFVESASESDESLEGSSAQDDTISIRQEQEQQSVEAPEIPEMSQPANRVVEGNAEFLQLLNKQCDEEIMTNSDVYEEVRENEMPDKLQVELVPEEIPVLIDVENRLEEMEEMIDWHTEKIHSKPKLPTISYLKANEKREEESQSVERVDLSMLFLQGENEDFVSHQMRCHTDEQIQHSSNTSTINLEDSLLRKEIPLNSGTAAQIEKYNLSDSPKKVQLDEADDFFQQTEAEESVIEENISPQGENALYLAKLFQSKEEKRTRMKIYFAQQGDSVQSLAIKFNVPIHHIHKFNQLEEDELKLGDAIYIPAKSKS